MPFLVSAESKSAATVDIELLKTAMQSSLKDADSAKFQNIRFGKGEHESTICGEINAKNSYGAYGGFKTFMATYLDLKVKTMKPVVFLIGIDSSNRDVADMCEKYGI